MKRFMYNGHSLPPESEMLPSVYLDLRCIVFTMPSVVIVLRRGPILQVRHMGQHGIQLTYHA